MNMTTKLTLAEVVAKLGLPDKDKITEYNSHFLDRMCKPTNAELRAERAGKDQYGHYDMLWIRDPSAWTRSMRIREWCEKRIEKGAND